MFPRIRFKWMGFYAKPHTSSAPPRCAEYRQEYLVKNAGTPEIPKPSTSRPPDDESMMFCGEQLAIDTSPWIDQLQAGTAGGGLNA
jgi:hypothetical protein